ncbi:MAG: metalloregulator ArsR/SmtB family transcription factor [Ignavibacteriaceae bacterium]|nr:metalloregulator ArsR/SmtB family transcription factor [Ignavibacteriaceae bacterium]
MKSLADASRLQVLNSLMDKPQYVEELAQRMNLAVSTVSFHLKKMEKAGLVYKTKEQYYIVYHIREDIFNKTLKELTCFENLDKFIQDERMEKYRQKVLKTFFKKDKLIKLPVQWKKKMLVLDEFVKKFKHGKKYTEIEVDNIIKQSYGDYCTVRRLMIDVKIMQRENQMYWLKDNQE